MKETNRYQNLYQQKLESAAEAVQRIQSGDYITISGATMQPFGFLAELSRRRDLKRVTVTSFMTLVPPDFLVRQFVAASRGEVPDRSIRYATYCVGPGDRQGAVAGVIDVIPVNARNIRTLLRDQRVDVVVVGSSGMDAEGNLNLGCNVDFMTDILAMAEQSDTLVVVEVNRSLPRTEGETTFRIEGVDHIIESRRPPVDLPMGRPLPEAQAIGGFLNSLVGDGSTLQLGVGDLVSQAASYLDEKRDLGVHSDLLGDVFYHLRERGALTGRRKSFLANRWVGAYVLGSRKLYEFVHENAEVELHPSEFVALPGNILRNQRMVSITQGSCVDLTGQVVGQTMEYEFLGNAGIQQTFHATAAACREGIGIVVLPSATESGRSESVVSSLRQGDSVAIPSTEVDTVVSEFGVARLRGKSAGERALNLISIAHPSQRDRLASAARKQGIL